MPDYGSVAYWDERYAGTAGASFDWYQTYDTLLPFLEPYLIQRCAAVCHVAVECCAHDARGARPAPVRAATSLKC